MDKKTKEKIQKIANKTGVFDKLDDGSTLFFSSDFILSETPDKKQVMISYHCDLNPDVASIISLELKDLFCKKGFFIDDMFTYKEDGDIVFGKEVVKIQEKQIEQEIQKRKTYDYLMESDLGIEV